jgi:hypothetical protein
LVAPLVRSSATEIALAGRCAHPGRSSRSERMLRAAGVGGPLPTRAFRSQCYVEMIRNPEFSGGSHEHCGPYPQGRQPTCDAEPQDPAHPAAIGAKLGDQRLEALLIRHQFPVFVIPRRSRVRHPGSARNCCRSRPAATSGRGVRSLINADSPCK